MYEDLATDAMLAMLRQSGVGAVDGLREDVSTIIAMAMELADDYPSGDDAAEAVLRGYRDGVQCPGCPEGHLVRAGGPYAGHCLPHWQHGFRIHSLDV